MNKTKPEVSIIIVNLNTGVLLQECIESLVTHESNSLSFEVIIIDQNSTDNSKEIILNLSEKFSFIKSIYNDTLKSFSYANNQGYDISEGRYILIMNPDIIFTESVLCGLINTLDKETGLGAICPMLIGRDGRFQQEYFRKYPSLRQFIFFYMIFSKPFYRSALLRSRYFENSNINVNSGKLEYVEQIPCAFFLTRRDLFEEAGKMDDKYILFYEDVDLSYQYRKKYKLAIDTTSKILHIGGQSFQTDENWWLHGRFLMSMHYFFEKNKSVFKSFLLKVLSISNSLLILTLEQSKILMGKKDLYRLNKHKYYLKEFKKEYL